MASATASTCFLCSTSIGNGSQPGATFGCHPEARQAAACLYWGGDKVPSQENAASRLVEILTSAASHALTHMSSW